jgi:Cu(I)/Ag(I) efflux system membrane fusion protein
MKTFIRVALIAAVLSFASTLEASDALKAIVGSYLEIQARLAADKADGIKAAAQTIEQQGARMGAGGEAIVKAAKAIEGAADIKAARDAFGPLSDAVIAAGNAESWKDVPDIRVAYCPMVSKSWLQKGDAIKNPYFGASMLNCGEIKKK